jgi:hypothetical protein
MMFARMLRCVIVTPLGSAVAPDVKITSASVVPVMAGPDVCVGSAPAPVGPVGASRCGPIADESRQVGGATAGGVTSSPTRMSFALTMAATRESRSGEAR